jgi:hypothetical protein
MQGQNHKQGFELEKKGKISKKKVLVLRSE